MMKRLIALGLLLMASVAAQAQPYPSPTYQNPKVLGNMTVGGTMSVAGATSLIGGGVLTGTFNGSAIIRGLTPGLLNVSSSGLTGLTGMQRGDTVFVIDCQNGSETFPGSGCTATYNGSAWKLSPNIPTLRITIGGQAVLLGGSTANQGNGSLVQTASGTTNNGDCAQFNSTGTLVDAGAPCGGGGGGGGSGTVTSALQGSIAAYSGSGSSTIVAGLGITNNAVLVTNGSGVPSESTTLPTGLSIPNPSISNATFTGTTTIGATAYTGTQTFAASTVSAPSIVIPIGVAPTSPVKGAEWGTTAGLYWRDNNNVSEGPFLYNVGTTGPLGGGGVGPSLTLTCTTCATTTNGGALTATAPMVISSGGNISLGLQPSWVQFVVPANVVVSNDTTPFVEQWPYANNGTLSKVIYHTGGITTPSFVATFQICTGGPSGTCTNVTGCSNLSVSSTSDTVATCTANNVVAPNQTIAQVISGVSGSPSSAAVQLTFGKPAS